MAIKIMFDASNNPEQPTVVLAKRNGNKLGMLNAKEISISDSFNDAPELSFKVYKELDGEQCPLWDEITNFKLIYCVEWNAWFEMTVELDESDDTVKTVFCTGLGYAELGQIKLYTIEINTEEDIARDDYKEPTVLFNEKNPKASLLHRIMEKAPHYTITHVDASIADIQRTFSFDDTSLYDAFQDIAEEIKCIFILKTETDDDGKLQRTIEVYDLQSYCYDCGHRGDYFDVCPECGSKNIKPGYGEDTTIFITADELADNIGFTTDTDAVKNCFKLEGGDDLMTATIRNCNPNGTDYLWYFSDDMKKDMPPELVEKIDSYDELYEYYQNDHVVIPGYTDSLAAYNNLIDKYKVFNEDLERIEAPVKGYPALMNAYYNTIDLNLYLTNSMMPSVETMETDATKELAKLTTGSLSPVAVQNVSVISNATADNVVISMAKLIVDSRFKVKVNSSSIVNSGNSCTWTGSFVVTNYYDEEDTATGNNIVVLINDDFEEFVKEKVEKQLSKEGDGEVDIVGLFGMTYNNFVNELRKYSLNRLRSFYGSCQSVLDVLIEQGVADKESWDGQDPNLYDDLYYPYLQKQNAISAEISVREQEISLIIGERDADGDLVTYGLQNYLDIYRDEIQDSLDFEKYLGEDLLLEFCAYRREDKYSNDNYISDALSNTELFDKAQEFIERATEEIHKSAEQQHSISSSLKNLLLIDKFKPIVDKFSVGNWLRIMVDDTLYKLRLINYEIDYDNIEDISVEFSDVIRSKDSASDIQSVLDQASDMATSYDSVKRQAEQGKNGNDKLNGWVNEGLSLTNMSIVGDADNQNMQWDEHGMLFREYLPITNTYDDRQLKIINRGLYVTDDNWTTSRAGIGNFRFYNPKTKEYEDAYGVIADTIVGNIVLSEEVGIYNKNNSITMDGDGFHITTSADALENSDVFVIQKENKQPDGSITLDKLLYFDNNGNLTINGSVRVYSSGSSTPSTDTTLGDVINSTTDAIEKVDVEYALGDNPNIAPSTGWATNSPVWTEGKYIWQRTATTTTSGKTSYSKPVCIQGAAGQDGIPGESASPVYFHVAYANSADGQTDFSTTDATNKKYMGTYVDDVPADSDDPTKYTWVLIKGEDGADGTPGTNGQDGKTYYLHIAYANNATGTEGFSTTDGTNKKYIGQCVDTNQADPTTPSSYTWSLFKGADGTDGLPGKDGVDGTSTYVHIKYSEYENPTDDQMTEIPNAYIGICTDNNQEDPTTASSYTWSKFEGKDGTDGLPGKDGEDGTSTFVHFAYATSSDGSKGFSTAPFDGALYIGVLTDNTQEDSPHYQDYAWSRMRGEDGTDGIPGKDGEDGTSSFVHIKYSDYPNPTDEQMKETPSAYIGICTDSTQQDPTTASSYTWSKFEGKDGTDGLPGTDGKDGTSSFVHFAYSTSADGSKNFSTTHFEGATHLGVLTNDTQEDSPHYQDYAWSLIKGADGKDGIPGTNGKDGVSSYVHIKYAPVEDPNDDQITETPDAYIGICVDSNQQDPTTASSYTWSKFKGQDGADGTPAAKVYVHFAYANSADGSQDFSVTQFDGAGYIGVLSDNTDVDSLNYQDYTWSQLKGDQGIPGANGKMIHIKYSDYPNPTDDQMKETAAEYIGICIDTNETDPTTASSYTWSKFEGSDGAPGADSFVHFAYSTSADGSQNFSVTSFEGAKYIGVYTDNTQADSTDYRKYTWSLIKGADGVSSYFHIKYSTVENPSDSDMTDIPSQYIGVCTTNSPIAPTTASSYIWSRFQGKDGDNGLSSFTHIAYAKSADGSDGFSVNSFPEATHIGILIDNNEKDSPHYQDYTWSQMRGTDGAPGQNGTFVHIKYSDYPNPTDSQMKEETGAYIGICVDRNLQDPTTASDYEWTKFEGEDGISTYTHIAYSTSADGSQNFNTSPFEGATYIGLRTDSQEADSPHYTDYQWSKFAGENGEDGVRIDDIREQYYLSTSDTTQKGGSWSYECPKWESGKYIWTRSEIIYILPDGTASTEYSPPVLAQAINDANEGVHEVKGYFVYDNSGLTIGAQGEPTSVKMASIGEFQVREGDDILARMSSDGTEILYNGSVVASYGSTTRIGSSSGYNTYIDGSGIKLKSGATELASLTSTEIVLGKTGSSNVRMASTGAFQVRSGSTVLAEMTSTQITVGRNTSGGAVKMLNSGDVQIIKNGSLRLEIGDSLDFYDSSGTNSFSIRANQSVWEDEVHFVSNGYGSFKWTAADNLMGYGNGGLYTSSMYPGLSINGCRANEVSEFVPSNSTGTFTFTQIGKVPMSLQYIVIYYECIWINSNERSVKIPLTVGETAYCELSAVLKSEDGQGVGVITETVGVYCSSSRNVTVTRNTPARGYVQANNANGYNANPGTQFKIKKISFCG